MRLLLTTDSLGPCRRIDPSHITNRFGTLARLTILLHNLAIVGNMAKEGGDMALLDGAKSAGDVGGAIHNEGGNLSLTNVNFGQSSIDRWGQYL